MKQEKNVNLINFLNPYTYLLYKIYDLHGFIILTYRPTNPDNVRDLHFLVRRRAPHSFRPVGRAG